MGEGVINGAVSSQDVLCCEARSWARFIGWFQIVVGAIAALVFLLLSILALAAAGAASSAFHDGVRTSNHDRMGAGSERDDDGAGAAVAVAVSAAVVALAILFIGTCILLLVAGIILVKGVNEGNPGKLQCWLIIEGICMAFVIVQFITNLTSGNYKGVVPDLISIPVGIFFIWVVNIHRRELLSARQTGFGPRI